jgi:transposase-like protein
MLGIVDSKLLIVDGQNRERIAVEATEQGTPPRMREQGVLLNCGGNSDYRPPKECRGEVAPKQWTRAVSLETTLMKQLNSRKHHSKEYRQQAVELLLTGRTFAELAAELHIGASTLKRWKEDYLADLAARPTDTSDLPPLKMWEELQRLRKENQKLKLHQEILKKAMGILSDLPPNGMP